MPTRPLTTRYQQDLALFPDRWHKLGLVLLALVVIAYPFVASAQWLTAGNLALIAIVGSVAMMILTGFAGQISLGHAAFLALGAYTVAALGAHLALPWWLALPAGGFVAAAVGLIIGPFALRLEGLYLAIVTLGLLFLVTHTLEAMPEITGGVGGIVVPMHGGFGGEATDLGFGEKTEILGVELAFEQKLYFVFAALAIAVAWAAANLARSRTGRAMMAVRDHDLAAAVLGVDPARTKVIAFGVSSFLAGIAGGMFAFQQQLITVSPPFDLSMSIDYIAMIVLGGIGTVFGAVWGALAFALLHPLAEALGELVREELGESIPMVLALTEAQHATLYFSLMVIGFLLFEPLGLYGIWLRIKRYFIAWPFRY